MKQAKRKDDNDIVEKEEATETTLMSEGASASASREGEGESVFLDEPVSMTMSKQGEEAGVEGTSNSSFKVVGLADAMNHPRRDIIHQRKQRHKAPGPAPVPAPVPVHVPQQPGAFPVDPMARQRQSNTRRKTKSKRLSLATQIQQQQQGQQQQQRQQQQPPPPPPPSTPPPPHLSIATAASNSRRQSTNLHADSSTTPHLISAQLVSDFDDDASMERDTIYQQAHRDAQRQVREDLLRDVIVADQVVDEHKHKQEQCRSWTAISACIVIVVATLAAVLGAQPWKKSDTPVQLNTVPVPANDLCTGALALSLTDDNDGDSQLPLLGDTRGASAVNFESCAASVVTGGLGLWYNVTGTGKPLRVSTCDSNSTYDTQLTLFQGSCQSHVCVGANDNGDDPSCGVSSSLTWPSVLGEMYIICVHGKFEPTPGTDDNPVLPVATPLSGTFQLTLDEMAQNDFCETATLIDIHSPVRGTTKDATSDSQVSFCHGTESSAPGVWFRIAGTGTPLQAVLTNVTTNLQLTIYQGTSSSNLFNNDPHADCRTIRCIAGYDNPFELDSQVTFATDAGVSYYILVHGVDAQQGSFELLVQETAQNDLCDTALELSLDHNNHTGGSDEKGSAQVVIQGSTALATFSGLSRAGAACNGLSQTAPGVWFSLKGADEEITIRAHTCVSGDDASVVARESLADTTLTVFRGENCQNLQCLVANDDSSCGQKSLVEWEAAKDEQYFILISGKADKRGSFQLTVESLVV
ncbi:expressed unknown protein [Seminavis robusta]|uniref:Uncharacterized protein n=1 Tax=Seminavis robusta TaxID=568900 RepID=A0A9N8F270_9STRA|nr:expressed unknown protein [Seminavis robusta]|eukprot:Sro2666_g334170.1 n/a (751) ;mRNA; f:4325-6577